MSADDIKFRRAKVVVTFALWIIAWIVVVGCIVWFFTLPTGNGELAPAVGTTTTEAG